MLEEGPGSDFARPNIDRRDLVRVGTAEEVVVSAGLMGLWGSEAAASKAEDARACSTFRTPSRISSAEAP